MATPILNRETILKVVREWTRAEQVALAQDILQVPDNAFMEEPIAAPDSHGLAGLIANGDTPPTDEDVARWLSELKG